MANEIIKGTLESDFGKVIVIGTLVAGTSIMITSMVTNNPIEIEIGKFRMKTCVRN